MKHYQWEFPLEWLNDRLDHESDGYRLRSYAKTLAQALDSDAIQDIFQEEMAADGYFEEVTT
jgi:hypothetical protein